MRTLAPTRGPLLGRQHATRHLDVLIGAARTGQGGSLVLRGEAGIGKSALLGHARQAAARESPVLCVVDDAQWLDRASPGALTFLARRVVAEPVAVVLAVRTPCEASELDVLPSLTVHGLGDADARILLAAQSHETLVEQVRDRLVAEARGNPLALLVLTGAGGFAHPRTTSVPAQVEHEFETALAGLPEGARLLLTVAAADPTGDPTLLWSAAHELGIDMLTAGATATATGLVEFGTRVRFRHPLARAAAYGAAETTERLRGRIAFVRAGDSDGPTFMLRAAHRLAGRSCHAQDV